jgi:hypothetical protein
MENSGLKQKTQEIQFSSEAVATKRVSPVDEFNNWSPETDHALQSIGDEPPDFPVSTQTVPRFPNARKNEANPFHF